MDLGGNGQKLMGDGRIGVRLVVAASVVLMLATGGCTAKGGAPQPGPSSSTPRPFTVMTTDRIITADPAAVTDQGR